MTAVNVIELYHENGQWMTLHMGPHADGILAVFGTNAIPTPYTSRASALYVMDRIATLNPDCDVQVDVASI
jgi:hypothetical protein